MPHFAEKERHSLSFSASPFVPPGLFVVFWKKVGYNYKN